MSARVPSVKGRCWLSHSFSIQVVNTLSVVVAARAPTTSMFESLGERNVNNGSLRDSMEGLQRPACQPAITHTKGNNRK